MKRLISMMLAVMLIATLGAVTAFAEPHDEHFIRFPGETADGLILPEAVVGESYDYTIQIDQCSDFAVTFTLDYDYGALPSGLTLNTDGTISGTPTTPTDEGSPSTFLIKVVANEECGDSGVKPSAEIEVSITVQPAPATITWRIPYTKRVVRGGSRNPGSQTFTLEIFDVGISDTADQVTISGDTGSIVTNGSGDYPGYVSVMAPAGALDEGFKVREKSGNAAHWTYSNAFYTIWPERGPDGTTFKIYEGDYSGIDGEGTECERMTFTNTYTYSPSRDRDDDDDDDYEPPVRETEEDKEPQPQKDEPKSNPSTGRGSTWDYLVYLFHKYFSWAA